MSDAEETYARADLNMAIGVVALLMAIVGMAVVGHQSGEISTEVATLAMYSVTAYGVLTYSYGYAAQNSGLCRRFWNLLGKDVGPTNAGENA
jgi:hypothetical protein